MDQKTNENLNSIEDQATKKMPSVEVKTDEPRRRRRSDVYENTEKTAETSEKASQQTKPQEEVPTYLQRQNVQKAAPQANHVVPQGGAPRPAALNRNQNGKDPRQPVKEPGYSDRKPLGYAMPADETMGRRPAGEEVKKGIPKAAFICLILVVILGIAAIALLLIPTDQGNLLGTVKAIITGEKKTETASVISMEASPLTGSVPADVAFVVMTNLAAQDVRLLNSDEEELNCTSTVTANASSQAWVLTVRYEEAFTGDVHVEVYDGNKWIETDWRVLLQLAASPLETPVPTEVPTQAPVEESESVDVEEEAVPTEEVIEEATEEPSPTPTGIPLAPVVGETAENVVVEEEAVDEYIPDESDDLFVMGDPEDAEEPDEPVESEGFDEVTEVTEEEPTDEAEPENQGEEPAIQEESTPEPTAESTQQPVVSEDPEKEAEREKLNIEQTESASLISQSKVYNGSKTVENYVRDGEIAVNMPYGSEYTPRAYGILTFRGDAFRQNAAQGTVENLSGMDIVWSYQLKDTLKSSGSKTVYAGIGQNSQPVIIQWSKEVREMSNMNDAAKGTKALREVIVAGENGKVYFLNLADGTETRDAIKVGYPMRATPSIHPYGFPVMAVGQYARKISGISNPSIGLRFYNLLNGKQLSVIDGMDGSFKRYTYGVGSFETSALMDAAADTMITAGTNGLVYVTKMGTDFNYNEQSITVNPTNIVLQSGAKGEKDKHHAVESSVVAYQDYLWFADMKGVLRCVNVNTLTTLWAVDTGDAVVASLALDMDTDGNLWVYTANTMTNRSKGDCQIRRYNAVTGEEGWTLSLNINSKAKKYTPGVSASPVIGQNGLSDLVFFTMNGLSGKAAASLNLGDKPVDAALIAIRKADGTVAWAKALNSYTYSSPVAVYSEGGKGWIIQASNAGKLTLREGIAGEEIASLDLEGNITGSPAVYKSTLVIGTQGGKNNSYIYGIDLK